MQKKDAHAKGFIPISNNIKEKREDNNIVKNLYLEILPNFKKDLNAVSDVLFGISTQINNIGRRK